MADDKKKQGKQDDNLISFNQNYEMDYALRQLQKQFPDETKKDVKEALVKAIKTVSPSEGRKKIMREAGKNLKD